MMGRGFSPGELEADRSDVAVLSYALWQQDFGGDRDVLGKTLHIGGVPRTVIGVMPPQFMFPMWENRPEAWVPVERRELTAANYDSYLYFSPVVRLKAGVPEKAVETQLAHAHAQFAKPGENEIQLAGVREPAGGRCTAGTPGAGGGSRRGMADCVQQRGGAVADAGGVAGERRLRCARRSVPEDGAS